MIHLSLRPAVVLFAGSLDGVVEVRTAGPGLGTALRPAPYIRRVSSDCVTVWWKARRRYTGSPRSGVRGRRSRHRISSPHRHGLNLAQVTFPNWRRRGRSIRPTTNTPIMPEDPEHFALWGYPLGQDDCERPLRLKEATVVADARLLRKLAAFFAHSADQLEEHEAQFGHEHFCDFAGVPQTAATSRHHRRQAPVEPVPLMASGDIPNAGACDRTVALAGVAAGDRWSSRESATVRRTSASQAGSPHSQMKVRSIASGSPLAHGRA